MAVPRPHQLVLGAATAAAIVAGAFAALAASTPSGTAVLRDPDAGVRSLIGFKVRYSDLTQHHAELVRTVSVPYRAWDGARRTAYLVLPRWYGPKLHPAIPLVISPHGRGVSPRDNVRKWGGLPAFGPFAVVNPEGEGRKLTLYSWGWRGQISDLARMPALLEHALPWLRLDRRRVYALGSSMGGQETLLLAALHPKLLAGAAALDSPTDMVARYYAFPQLYRGGPLQALARQEFGGTPTQIPAAYSLRSPLHYVQQLAFSDVPLHIWWSRADRIVIDQQDESGRLYRAIRKANPHAPVSEYVGAWVHSKEMQPLAKLPLALLELHIIRLDEPRPNDSTVVRTRTTAGRSASGR